MYAGGINLTRTLMSEVSALIPTPLPPVLHPLRSDHLLSDPLGLRLYHYVAARRVLDFDIAYASCDERAVNEQWRGYSGSDEFSSMPVTT